jgi:hypothetical protein
MEERNSSNHSALNKIYICYGMHTDTVLKCRSRLVHQIVGFASISNYGNI